MIAATLAYYVFGLGFTGIAMFFWHYRTGVRVRWWMLASWPVAAAFWPYLLWRGLRA